MWTCILGAGHLSRNLCCSATARWLQIGCSSCVGTSCGKTGTVPWQQTQYPWRLWLSVGSQYFSKRIPGPSRLVKIDMFCLVELCLTCAFGLYKRRSSILRISLPSPCSRQFAEDSGALGGLAAAGKSLCIGCNVLSCRCRVCGCICGGCVHVVTAGQGRILLLCRVLLQSVSGNVSDLCTWCAPVFPG